MITYLIVKIKDKDLLFKRQILIWNLVSQHRTSSTLDLLDFSFTQLSLRNFELRLNSLRLSGSWLVEHSLGWLDEIFIGYLLTVVGDINTSLRHLINQLIWRHRLLRILYLLTRVSYLFNIVFPIIRHNWQSRLHSLEIRLT